MARQALYILGRSLGDIWENLMTIITANLIWSTSLIPTILLMSSVGGLPGVGLALFLAVIIVAPGTLALFVMTAYVDRREKLEMGEFWRGYRHYYRRAWLLGLINMVFLILAFYNVVFYASGAAKDSPLQYAAFLWFYLLFMWFCMQLFLWPLAVRMEKIRLVPLLRNTLLATFKYPLLSLIVGSGLAAFVLLSALMSFVPLVVFGTAYFAIAGNKALTLVLAKEAERAGRGGSGDIFRVEAPDLPEKAPEEPGGFSTRNTPPGVTRRGVPGWPSDEPSGQSNRRRS